jgi:D(-)-tartrate dehydratase
MALRIVEARERTVAIGAPMRNAAIAFDAMTASAVTLITDEGVAGYAFDSIGRYGKGALLRERFFPRLLAAPPDSLLDSSGLIDPPACARAAMLNEKPGGHGERPGAIGLIEAAAWDLRAKLQRVPLWRALADYYKTHGAAPSIRVYASCGHFRDDRALADEVALARDAGYACVKIKVAGTLADRERTAAIARDGPLAVDLNGALAPDMAERWFATMADFGFAWIEEPAPPLDYELLQRYVQMSETPLATGENLFSHDDARNLARYGGLRRERDLLQFDPLLAYGVAEYVRILALYAGWDRRQFLPHAGHLFAAHCVAGLALGMAEAAPDTALPYGGYWDGVRVRDGCVKIPDLPGVGYEAKGNLFALLEST